MYNAEPTSLAMRSVTRTPITLSEWKKHLHDIRKFSSSFWTLKPSIRIDNLILTLHSTVTVQILMIGTMFVTMRQYFGDPIDCLTKDSDIKTSLIEHYCWIEGAFSVINSSPGTSAYPGVAPTNAASLKRHHKYYQWVYFVLIIQAIMFYVPKFLWRSTESGRLRELIGKLSGRSVSEIDESSRIQIVQEVADNLSISHNYLITVVLCEVYCLFHLALQIWFTNIFLGGTFYTLGPRWLAYANHRSPEDPLIAIFPRMVKCTFHKYGFSGTMETKDALCFLPLNIVNEKIYTILWLWFAGLFVITVFHLTIETTFISFRPLRTFRVTWLAPGCNQIFIRGICRRAGHWLVLSYLAANIKPSHFRDLMGYLERDHYDRKGRPLHISRIGQALSGIKITGKPLHTASGLGKTKSSRNKSKHGSSSVAASSSSHLHSALLHGPLRTSSKVHYEPVPPKAGFIGASVPDWGNNQWTASGLNEKTGLTSEYSFPIKRAARDDDDDDDDDNNDECDWHTRHGAIGKTRNRNAEDDDDDDDDDDWNNTWPDEPRKGGSGDGEASQNPLPKTHDNWENTGIDWETDITIN